jgi:hypothetical protein
MPSNVRNVIYLQKYNANKNPIHYIPLTGQL